MSGSELLIDGAIIVVYFAVILFIGLYMGRRENTLHDFALGGRNVPWWAVMASIIAAETSAATFLGVPGEGYKTQSIVYTQLAIGLILGRIVVGTVFLKPYFLYKVYTVYDFLAVRFGEKSKSYASALFLVMRTLAAGSRVFVPSLVMVLAWRLWHNGGGNIEYAAKQGEQLTPYVVAIIGLVIVTCLYTAIGGIKAVIWTDLVQASLMFGSAIIAIITILYHIGGNSWNLANGFHALLDKVPQMRTHLGYFWFGSEHERVADYVAGQAKIGRILNPDHLSAWEWCRLMIGSEYTWFSAIVGGTMGNIAAFGTDQDMVQRLLTAESYKKSRRSLITAAIMDVPVYGLFAFIGVLLVVYFKEHPKFLPKSNADVFGSYIMNVMPVGIRGLILAGIFATAMGSLSAALNALATSLTNDWYIPKLARDRSEGHHVAAARVFTGFFAVLMVLIAVGTAYVNVKNPNFRIIPFVIGAAGLFLGPMLGVFLLGMFTRRRGSDGGNVLAITVGLVTMFFITGQHVALMNMIYPAPSGQPPIYHTPAWLPAIAWNSYAMVGGVLVFVIGALFRTPESMVEYAENKRAHSGTVQDKPMALR